MVKSQIKVIGGIIVVVIVLLIIIYFGSVVSTAIEDSDNKDALITLGQGMAKAMTQYETTITPWKLYTGVDDRNYAIIFIDNYTAACLLGYSSQSCNINPPRLDEQSRSSLKNCNEPTDLCLCLFRITYKNPFFKSSCDDLNVNIITLPSKANYNDEKRQLRNWRQDKFLPIFQANAVTNLKVLRCLRIRDELGCVYHDTSTGIDWPCLLHYNGKLVTWIGAEGGPLNVASNIDIEILILNKTSDTSWYLDFVPDDESKADIKVRNNMMPCDTNCGECGLAPPTPSQVYVATPV